MSHQQEGRTLTPPALPDLRGGTAATLTALVHALRARSFVIARNLG